MTRAEVVALICRKADENGLVRAEFLGGAVAESALIPTARRPRDASQDTAYWPDVSFGLFQQTARFADEGDQSMRADNIRFIEELYSDPEHACTVAARKFKHYRTQTGNALDAWCRYNWPARTPDQNPNRANYASGLAEARTILGGSAVADVAPILNRVLELARAEIGKPYSGPIVGEPDSYRYGDPGYDCSSFVSEMYRRATNGAVRLAAYTESAYTQCEWVQQPQAGDICFYHYQDSQEIQWPHMGLWLNTSEVLDCRYGVGLGVGVHPHVTPVGPDAQGRYRRTMRPKGLANVAPPVTVPTDPRDATIAALTADRDALRLKLDEALMHLGVASVDYADGLQNLVTALRALKPAA